MFPTQLSLTLEYFTTAVRVDSLKASKIFTQTRTLNHLKKMQKLGIIFVILCALTLQQVESRRFRKPPKNYTALMINYTIYDRPNYTQEVDLSIHGSIQSFTLLKNETQIFLNSSNKQFKPCMMDFKTLGFAFQVAPFNDQIILWDQQTAAYNVMNTTLLLIQPFGCKYKNVSIPVDVIPMHQSPYKMQVLTYKNLDYFDVFFGGRTTCMPCRFTNLGENVKISDQLWNVTIPDANPYIIRPLNESNSKFGYFYAHSFYNESLKAEINLLDSNFNPTNRLVVDEFVDAVAIDEGNENIVVCYKKENHHYVQTTEAKENQTWRALLKTEVYCDVYDNDLELDNHIKLSIPTDHYVNGISVRIGKDRVLCIAVPHVSYTEKYNKYSLSFFRFTSLDQSSSEFHGSHGSIFNNFDDKHGYHVKVRAQRFLYSHCP